MSSDIRKFFAKSDSKRSSSNKAKSKEKPKPAPIIIDDDDDDDDFKVKKKKLTVIPPKKRRLKYDSDSDEDVPKKKPSPSTVSSDRQEILSASDFFGSAPVKRSKLPSKRTTSDSNIAPDTVPESPPFIDQSPESLELKEEVPPVKKFKQSIATAASSTKQKISPNKPTQTKELPLSKKVSTPPKKGLTPPKKGPTPPKKELTPPKKELTPLKKGPTPPKKELTPPKKEPTPPKKDLQETPKLSRGASYRAYLDRGGPKAPGSKSIPKGATNCLSGLTFVFTGVGESLDRDEATQLAKDYGAKVTTSLSKKTSYLVVGDEPGDSKLAKAKTLNTKQINEDEFLELIRTRSEVKEATPSKKDVRTSASKKGRAATTPSRKTKTTTATPQRDTEPSTPSSTNIGSSPATPTATVGVSTPPTPLQNVNLMWVDKYRPTSTKGIIGQQTNKSNVKKLTHWLQNWHTNNRAGVTHKEGAAATSNDGSNYKAALLSGPPGIGKTTTAVLVCKELGFTYTELNASSTRSKRTLQENVASSLNSLTMDSFVTGSVAKRHAFIMDEVDGMAGNEDRGGVQELIQLIKTSLVPIIFICNDRQHTKIRSLANYCYDLRFSRPKVEHIKGPMMSVAYKEGIKISPQALQEIIEASCCDIRQVLHNLSVWSAADKILNDDKMKEFASEAKKRLKLGPFDVIKTIFNPVEKGRELSLREKSDLFFQDYSLGPLFVQENYLRVKPHRQDMSRVELLKSISEAADAISNGDLISKIIRTINSWDLLPTQAVYSSVLPGDLMKGSLGKPEFPQWLGQNSKTGKNVRLLQEIYSHSGLSCLCNRLEFAMDYLPFLQSKLTQPLINEGNEGVREVVDTLHHYDLTREDWENVIELTQYNGSPSTMSLINSKVKAALTRTINKDGNKLPYDHHSQKVITKKRTRATFEDDIQQQTSNGSEELSDTTESDQEEDPSIFAVNKREGNNTKKRKT